MHARDRERYSRQILFQGIGEAGQEHLLRAHVAIVGCGALGSFQAAALARSGVGTITVIDRDYVEWSNLQRQWLFEESDAEQSMPKAAAAERRLGRINGGVTVRGVIADLISSNCEQLLGDAGLILDGTDNFETRYLINDFAVSRAKPWIYGGAVGGYGITMPVMPPRTACLRCLYPNPPAGAQPTCETAGILNAAISAVASFQVADALKILSGNAMKVIPRITTIEIWDGAVRQIPQPAADPECPACGLRQFTHLTESRRAPAVLCGRNAVQVHEGTRAIDIIALGKKLEPLGEVRANEFALRFFSAPYEMTVFRDGRAIIKGTDDTALARSLYSRYLGS
jgi:adenylyltransferase/sulfurtransferase